MKGNGPVGVRFMGPGFPKPAAGTEIKQGGTSWDAGSAALPSGGAVGKPLPPLKALPLPAGSKGNPATNAHRGGPPSNRRRV